MILHRHRIALVALASVAATPSHAATIVIKTLAELQNVENNLAGSYELGADIDASATKAWHNGAGFIPIGAKGLTPAAYKPFTGTFNGAGHKIEHLTFGAPGTWIYTGLFAEIGTAGKVENLTLSGVSATSDYQGYNNGKAETGYIAALAAINHGTVFHVTATGMVGLNGYQNVVAGLVGYNDGLVESAVATVTVIGNSINAAPDLFVASGLVGVNVVDGKVIGRVVRSSSTGAVSGEISNNGSSGFGMAGGLVGLNEGVIEQSTSSRSVACGSCFIGGLVAYHDGAKAVVMTSRSSAAVSASGWKVGGLVGYNTHTATVESSAASGTVTTFSQAEIGGLVGENDGLVKTSHATGEVVGSKNSETNADIAVMGGLVGMNDQDGVVETSYATGEVTDRLGQSGYLALGGLVGVNSGGGKISQCFATGSIVGIGFESVVGGLVGENSNGQGVGSIENSYALGPTIGSVQSDVGALIGQNDGGSISLSYGVGKVAGGKNALLGGVMGDNAGAAAKTYWDMTTTRRVDAAAGGPTGGMRGEGDAKLKSATLPAGFSAKIWQAKAGAYPSLRAVPAP